MRVAKKRASAEVAGVAIRTTTDFVLFALLARRLLLAGILEETCGAGRLLASQESSEKCLTLRVELSRSRLLRRGGLGLRPDVHF